MATLCPSELRWCEHFTLGISTRMGDIVSQDWAYTIQALHALLKSFQEEWLADSFDMDSQSLFTCMFLLESCLGGMRGFEVVLTDLAALRYDLECYESMLDYSVVSWSVVGRFKGHDK